MLGESPCIKQNVNSKTKTDTKYTIGITKNQTIFNPSVYIEAAVRVHR